MGKISRCNYSGRVDAAYVGCTLSGYVGSSMKWNNGKGRSRLLKSTGHSIPEFLIRASTDGDRPEKCTARTNKSTSHLRVCIVSQSVLVYLPGLSILENLDCYWKQYWQFKIIPVFLHRVYSSTLR